MRDVRRDVVEHDGPVRLRPFTLAVEADEDVREAGVTIGYAEFDPVGSYFGGYLVLDFAPVRNADDAFVGVEDLLLFHGSCGFPDVPALFLFVEAFHRAGQYRPEAEFEPGLVRVVDPAVQLNVFNRRQAPLRLLPEVGQGGGLIGLVGVRVARRIGTESVLTQKDGAHLLAVIKQRFLPYVRVDHLQVARRDLLGVEVEGGLRRRVVPDRRVEEVVGVGVPGDIPLVIPFEAGKAVEDGQDVAAAEVFATSGFAVPVLGEGCEDFRRRIVLSYGVVHHSHAPVVDLGIELHRLLPGVRPVGMRVHFVVDDPLVHPAELPVGTAVTLCQEVHHGGVVLHAFRGGDVGHAVQS